MTNVRTTNKGENIESMDLFYNLYYFPTPIAAYTSSDIYYYAPIGSIEKLNALVLLALAPVGATLGVHSFQLDNGTGVLYMLGESLFGSNLQYIYYHWIIANSSQLPPDPTAQLLIIDKIIYDTVYPLRCTYLNNTDVVQTQSPYIRIKSKVVRKW